MALTISTPFELSNGTTIETSYARVGAADGITGAIIQAVAIVYLSEQAYLDGKEALSVPFEVNAHKPYDRTTDGTDILDIAHDMLIEALATQGISATKTL